MGVAVLSGTRLTYWRAGHLPLFLLLGRSGATLFKALLARGNPLGLSPTVQTTPQYIDIAPGFPVRALIGSDGVFRRGTLTGKTEVESVYTHVRATGALADATDAVIDDDRTLVMLERDFEPASTKAG
jgi:serine phosphatase RsbU (regulator of sigma subunit)